MSKQKIWSDFNHLECGKTKKKIRRNMEFQQALGNLFSWKNGFATFSSRLPFIRLNVSKLMLILPEV